MTQGATTRYYQPADGFLRLSRTQIGEIRRLYGLLSGFLAEQPEAEARLIIVVKRGKVRFGEVELPAGNIPRRGLGQMPDALLLQVDARLSSLCGFTEHGGEARLVLAFSTRSAMKMRMVLSQELAPGH
jgi:hypothetical protein